MADIENNILVQISEFVYTEMDEIKSVKHETKTSFVIQTNDGKEFIIEIKDKKINSD